MTFRILDASFYVRDTLELAQALIGKLLVKESDEGIAAGYIVETEAYMGADDRAAHSFGNRRTPRTEIMFGEPGRSYVYTMHTHCLFNVVSGAMNTPHAVLVRAVEPVIGIELMRVRRGDKKDKDLTNGPGKLCKALNITMKDYGLSLQEPPLFIAEGREAKEIVSGPRIGIDNTGEAKDYPWRFYEIGNPYVSR